MRTGVLATSLLFVIGCGTYRVNRAALAPHAAPSLATGQPLDGAAEMRFGASSLAHSTGPSVGDPEAAVEIPGTQLHADGRVRLSDVFALGLIYENGLDATAERPKGAAQPPVDAGNVQGYGVVADLSIPTNDPKLRVGLSFEGMLWRIPYVEYQTCTADCPLDEPWTFMEEGFDDTDTFAIAITPSYDLGTVRVFGGLTARQHPTIQQKDIEQDPILDVEPEVESGPFNIILSAGVEAELAGGALKLLGIVYQNVTQDPVQYGPGMAALISVPIGRKAARPREPQVIGAPPAPAPYYPPPPPAPAPPPPAPM